MSWWKFWETEDEEEQKPPMITQIAERIANSPRLLTELAVKTAEAVLREYPREVRAMVVEGTDLAVQRWQEEATAKLQAAIEELVKAPGVMRRMDAIEQGQEAMQGQLSQVLAMITDYLQTPQGDMRDNPVIADIIRRLEILERQRQIIPQTSPTHS